MTNPTTEEKDFIAMFAEWTEKWKAYMEEELGGENRLKNLMTYQFSESTLNYLKEIQFTAAFWEFEPKKHYYVRFEHASLPGAEFEIEGTLLSEDTKIYIESQGKKITQFTELRQPENASVYKKDEELAIITFLLNFDFYGLICFGHYLANGDLEDY